MPYFTTGDGARLHYTVAGSGSPALIFIHGWCSNLRHWDRQVPAFSRRHRVLRVDRRGHGRSSAPAAGWSPRQHADDVAALAGSFGISGAVAVGHAGGGPTTLELAGRHPALVRAAVFVDAGLYRGRPKAEAERADTVVDLREREHPAELMRRYERFFHPQSGADLARRAAADAGRTPHQVAVHELEWILRANTAAMAKRVKQPVLWLVSSNSRASAESVRAHLPQAEFAQTVRAGHFLHLEAPEQFNPMLRRFLDGLGSKPAVSSRVRSAGR